MPQHNSDFKEDVKALIELGNTGITDPMSLDSSITTQKRIMASRGLWRSISETLTEKELYNLIKGLVHYENTLKNNSYGLGGSAGPGIILCEMYALRFPDKETELFSWVIDNRINPYLPYGSFLSKDKETF